MINAYDKDHGFEINMIYNLKLKNYGFARGRSSVVQCFEVLEIDGKKVKEDKNGDFPVIYFSAKGTNKLIDKFINQGFVFGICSNVRCFEGEFVMKKQGINLRWEPI